MFTRELAKHKLKATGWSYRAAAPRLGVTYQHLCMVLCGHRQSARLLAAIQALPARECGEGISNPFLKPSKEAALHA